MDSLRFCIFTFYVSGIFPLLFVISHFCVFYCLLIFVYFGYTFLQLEDVKHERDLSAVLLDHAHQVFINFLF